jgi:hypothetical protein
MYGSAHDEKASKNRIIERGVRASPHLDRHEKEVVRYAFYKVQRRRAQATRRGERRAIPLEPVMALY